jgi:hypothetical protein
MARFFGALLFLAACFVLSAQASKATCDGLTGDANLMSNEAKQVETYEKSRNDGQARTAWNLTNHYTVLGAEQFKDCRETMAHLAFSVSLANASAIGMHFGFLPWSDGVNDIAASLQLIDALPHSSVVEKEWKLVDRLYVEVCARHKAVCKPVAY